MLTFDKITIRRRNFFQFNLLVQALFPFPLKMLKIVQEKTVASLFRKKFIYTWTDYWPDHTFRDFPKSDSESGVSDLETFPQASVQCEEPGRA